MVEKADIILLGAIELFKNVSIKSVSMDDIARELKISKKTLYQYFKNKEDLIEATLNYYIENDHTKYVAESNNTHTNAIDELLTSSRWVSDNFKNINPSHVFDLKKYYPEQYANFWTKKRQQVYDGIKSNIERGISEGIYRADLNIDLTAGLHARRLENMHFNDDDFFRKYSFEEVFKTIFENHIRSISNNKGLEYFETKRKDFLL